LKKAAFFILAILLQAKAHPHNQTTPQRVISLSPHITEMVFAVGAGSSLIAADNYSDWPKETRSLPKVGDAFSLNVEYLAKLKPDLVLVWRSGTSAEKVSQLRRLNIPLMQLEPSGVLSVADDMEMLGRLFGTETMAKKAAASYRHDIQQLSDRYSGKTKVSLFYQIDEYPLYTIGGNHIISEAIALCGGRNVFDDLSAIAPPVSKEAVLVRQPQLIVGTPKEKSARIRIAADWASMPFIPAVRRGNIQFLDPDLITRAGPRLPKGIAQLCRAIHSAR
jgi:iron complex transport system substrate-binding protein